MRSWRDDHKLDTKTINYICYDNYCKKIIIIELLILLTIDNHSVSN